ncbi:MAG: DUF6809 family protein [Clostridia bacterium]
MMNTVLKQLYEGQIAPIRNYSDMLMEARRNNALYDDFLDQLNAIDTGLSKSFMRILDEQYRIFSNTYATVYTDGMQMGARMMMELLTDNPKDV